MKGMLAYQGSLVKENPSLAAHGFLAILKQNFHFLRSSNTLHQAQTKDRMIDKGFDFVGLCHVVS